MWLGLLGRFWPWLAGAVALIGLALYINHAGYKSGYAASEAHWQPLFAAATLARDEANARAAVQEARSKAQSDQSEKEHAESLASLALRADAAERSNRSLVRELAARARSGAVSQASGPASVADATTASDERLAGAADRFTDLARRCEADAATLAELQRWVTGQRSIFN